MRKFVLIALTSLLLSAIFASAQTDNAQVTGSVAYRERIALPPDAVINVQLVDTSVADIAAQTVADVMINAEGRQVPVPFTLTYNPTEIVTAHRYSVRATIRSGDGMLMFSSTQAYPVLTHGAPSKVNLILHTVGHGAKPGATAKKQAPAKDVSEPTPASSQTVPPASPESAPPITATSAVSAPAPSAIERNSAEPAKPEAQEEAKSEPTEGAVPPPQSVPETASDAAPTPSSADSATTPACAAQSVPSEVAPVAGESANRTAATESAPTKAAPSTPANTEQPAPASEPPSPVVAEQQPAPLEPKPAEVPLTPEHVTPLDSATEPTTPAQEAKSSEPEAPLPEAPSATKRSELEAAAPDSTEPEDESTSRPNLPAPNKALTPLADTQWKLVQLNGQDVVITPPQKPVTLAFSPEGRRIAGSAGCNSYLGSFTDDHGRLHLVPGNMTMMACMDPAGTRERKFIAMLRLADGYKISGDVLLLTRNGKTVAKFQNNQ